MDPPTPPRTPVTPPRGLRKTPQKARGKVRSTSVSKNFDSILEDGTSSFSQGNYQTALILFRAGEKLAQRAGDSDMAKKFQKLANYSATKVGKGGAGVGVGGGEGDSKSDQTQIPTFEPDDMSKDKITFDDLYGLHPEKQQINITFIQPLMYPKALPSRSNALLLYGPPGTGKTLIARAFYNEYLRMNSRSKFAVNFFVAKNLKDKYVGGTERTLTGYWESANKLVESQIESGQYTDGVSIIFMDEFESVGKNRSDGSDNGDSVTSLLKLMDGAVPYPYVILIAATNYPDDLDEGLMRRLKTRVMIDTPSDIARRDIMWATIRKLASIDELSDKENNMLSSTINKMVKKTGFSRRGYEKLRGIASDKEQLEVFDRYWSASGRSVYPEAIFPMGVNASDMQNIINSGIMAVGKKVLATVTSDGCAPLPDDTNVPICDLSSDQRKQIKVTARDIMANPRLMYNAITDSSVNQKNYIRILRYKLFQN